MSPELGLIFLVVVILFAAFVETDRRRIRARRDRDRPLVPTGRRHP